MTLISALALVIAACSDKESKPSGAAPDASADAALDAAATCGKGSAAALRSCVRAADLGADLAVVAQPREPGSAHWQAVQDLCKQRFEQYGFTVTLDDYGSGVNVVGVQSGSEKPAERVIVSAHYDHIAGCAGADDNGTGVVAVLETARVLGGVDFARTLVVACWDEEESGLLGAEAYAANAKQQGENIVAMYSLEMLGFKSSAPNSQKVPTGLSLLFPEQYAELEQNQFVGDFLALVPDTSARPAGDRVQFHAVAIGLRTVMLEITDNLKSNPLAADVRRSDHAAFWDQDFPAMMLTDTSEFRNPNYHCRNGTADTPDTLVMDFLAQNTRAVVGSVVDLLELR